MASASPAGGPGEIGKGLFGYRKSDVAQLLADRDNMLRQAEKRVRAAEARIAELEKTVTESNERNARMEEQVRRLRRELDATAVRTGEVEQHADQVRAEAERMTAWKRNLETLVGPLVPTVERFRALTAEVPLAVDEAFGPLTARIGALVGLIEDFGRLVGRTQASPQGAPQGAPHNASPARSG